ncbi:hypothetical protein [Streptomyces sp. NRRL F-2664]|uniref:hypothetical protein n=1 Tax=Streptomyces sp. NRRL F-2664 TaxID=1463842 RepID=UPI0004C8B559|nr:hypothetical protein [Streptomyces sp. NRRL F-2664]
MGEADEVRQLVAAASGLPRERRGRRWAHTSLCVLDAVFSINADYDRHTAPTCHRYATWARIPPHLPAPDEQPLGRLVADIRKAGTETFSAEVLRNLQRTRAHPMAPRKTEAALRYAETLTFHGVHTLADADALLADADRLKTVEHALAGIPGHGSGARLSYLWMLLGADDRIKPDRMILRWLEAALHRPVTPQQAIHLLKEASASLNCTPWELDHAIWKA